MQLKRPGRGGGMADAGDLKSPVGFPRAGSSPAPGTLHTSGRPQLGDLRSEGAACLVDEPTAFLGD